MERATIAAIFILTLGLMGCNPFEKSPAPPPKPAKIYNRTYRAKIAVINGFSDGSCRLELIEIDRTGFNSFSDFISPDECAQFQPGNEVIVNREISEDINGIPIASKMKIRKP